MVESALDSETQVHGFADRLGERFIVPQPSGSLLEHLHFRRDLSSAPFFEGAVKERLSRLGNFRHASYTRVRRLRGGDHGELVLVSTHVPGRRLAEVLQVASRNGIRPPAPAVLWLTRQLLTSVALLHDYGPDVFHGAIGPERLVLAGEGRVVLAEYVLGSAVEHAVGPWGVHHLWRELRVPALLDFDLPAYGRRLDLLQIALVALAGFLGRPLGTGEFPEGLPQAIAEATEAGPDGSPVPLRPALRDWLERMASVQADGAFRTLLEGQKAFGQLLEEGDCSASSSDLQGFLERCEAAPWCQQAPERASEATPEAATGPAQEAAPEPGPRPGAQGVAAPAAEREAAPPATAGFGPWPVAEPARSAAALFDAFQPVEPAQPSAADLVTRAPESPAAEAPPAPGGEESWAPTPDRDVRTLFEAPSPAAAVEPASVPDPYQPAWPQFVPAPSLAPAGGQEARQATGATPVAEPVPTIPPAVASPEPAVEPGRPRPAGTSDHSHRSGAVTSRRIVARRASFFTPGRIGVAAAGLVAVVLLALAVPRFWSPGVPEGTLVVESEPAGAEVTLDGQEVGTTPLRLKTAPGAHKLEVGMGGSSRSVWVNVPEDDTLRERVELPEAMQRSGLRITTHPPGGTVSIDGAVSGKSSVRVSDLQPGFHVLSVEGPFGPVEQEVRVEPGQVATVQVATAGWVRVKAPFSLNVTERGRVYGNTGEGAVMVPVGRHHFELENRELHLKVRQFADVPPGETITLPFEAPSGMLNLDADQQAEVWVDGRMLGQTPLVSVAVPLGRHEVVFRHAKLGEVRYTVLVTLAAPARLSVTFAKKK